MADHEGAAAASAMLTGEASNSETKTDSTPYAGQIVRMPVVAAMNRRTWRTAGRAAPMITARMSVDYEPIGASHRMINMAAGKDEGGNHPDLESARRPCVPQCSRNVRKSHPIGDPPTPTCHGFATTSSGLWIFLGFCPSSRWLDGIVQAGPLQWGNKCLRQDLASG